MDDRGVPFADAEAWERLVLSESRTLVPAEAWGRRWEANGCALVPIIRSVEVPLPAAKARSIDTLPGA
jgi:hypothetical protein